jgi:hypothetical protein
MAEPEITTRIVKPDPDPTILTTEAQIRANEALEKYLTARIDAVEQTLAGLARTVDSIPSERQMDIRRLQELMDTKLAVHEQRFATIALQFEERDVRSVQSSTADRTAIAAALQAAKEAVGEQNKSSSEAIRKSEAATSRQIEQQSILIANTSANLTDKIDDVKERLTIIEGVQAGARAAHTTTQSTQQQWVGIIGLGITALVVLVGLVVFLNKPAERVYVDRPLVERPLP